MYQFHHMLCFIYLQDGKTPADYSEDVISAQKAIVS